MLRRFAIYILKVVLALRRRVHGFLHDDMSRRLVSSGVALDLYCETAEEQLSARALLNTNARLRHYR